MNFAKGRPPDPIPKKEVPPKRPIRTTAPSLIPDEPKTDKLDEPGTLTDYKKSTRTKLNGEPLLVTEVFRHKTELSRDRLIELSKLYHRKIDSAHRSWHYAENGKIYERVVDDLMFDTQNKPEDKLHLVFTILSLKETTDWRSVKYNAFDTSHTNDFVTQCMQPLI